MRRAVRRHRRHPAGEIIVVHQHPAILELAPADAGDVDRDVAAGRRALGRDVHRHVDREPGLGDEAGLLLQLDVVGKAEIVGRGEAGGGMAGIIAPHHGDAVADRNVGAAVIFAVRDFPGAVDGAPHQVKGLAAGQPVDRDADRGSRRPVLGRQHHARGDRARGFGRRHCRARRRRARGREADDRAGQQGGGETQHRARHLGLRNLRRGPSVPTAPP